MKAQEAVITLIDFETTGVVNRWPNEPWQIGLALFEGGTVKAGSTLRSFLRVGARPFNPHAPGNPESHRDDIARAPTLREMWAELRPWLVGRPLAAHNAATEKKLVREAAPLHRAGPWIDTLKLVRHAYPALASHALQDILDELKLAKRARKLCPGLAPHDALYDAVACGLLLEHLLKLPGWENLSIADLAAAHPSQFHRAVAARTARPRRGSSTRSRNLIDPSLTHI